MTHKEIVKGILITFIVVLILAIIICSSPAAACDTGRITTKRQDALHDAAELLRSAGYSEDSDVIQALSAEWWKEQEDLDIIAKVIANEADPQWCEWEHSVAVGVVVLNRVKSDHFPNTVRDVVNAPGQYLPAYTWGFDATPRKAYEAAKAAMDGDHEVPEDCFWQDNKIQGTSIWKSFVCDTGWFRSTTYICRGIVGVG